MKMDRSFDWDLFLVQFNYQSLVLIIVRDGANTQYSLPLAPAKPVSYHALGRLSQVI
jgi:hypothetical protein